MKAIKNLIQFITAISIMFLFFGCNGNETKAIEIVREFEVTGGSSPYKIRDVEETLIEPKWQVMYIDANKTHLVRLSGIYDNGDITDKDIQELWFTVSSDFTMVDAGGTGDSHIDLVNTMILIRNWPRQVTAWQEAHKKS